MTTDEFEKILMALTYMHALNVNGRHMVPLEGVIKVIHVQLRPEDRTLYTFDFERNSWQKKDIS